MWPCLWLKSQARSIKVFDVTLLKFNVIFSQNAEVDLCRNKWHFGTFTGRVTYLSLIHSTQVSLWIVKLFLNHCIGFSVRIVLRWLPERSFSRILFYFFFQLDLIAVLCSYQCFTSVCDSKRKNIMSGFTKCSIEKGILMWSEIRFNIIFLNF